MIRTRDILSLTEFRQNATAHLDRLAETRSAEVLTVNGKARGVVLAPDVFDELVEKAELQESLASIDRAMEDFRRERAASFREALRSILRSSTVPPSSDRRRPGVRRSRGARSWITPAGSRRRADPPKWRRRGWTKVYAEAGAACRLARCSRTGRGGCEPEPRGPQGRGRRDHVLFHR